MLDFLSEFLPVRFDTRPDNVDRADFLGLSN